MGSTNPFVRALALFAAYGLIMAASLLMASPLKALVWMAVVMLGCWLCGMLSERRAMLFARAGPGPVGPAKAFDDATYMARDNGAMGASGNVGFRLCRSSRKGGMTGTMTTHFTSGKVNMTKGQFALWSSKHLTEAQPRMRQVIPRKSQCNLYAFNANDQCGFACVAAA